MRLRLNQCLPFAALVLISSCAFGSGRVDSSPPLASNGPAADYPVEIGDPFTIEGVTYTPSDTLNYDAVGYAITGKADSDGVDGAHKTLPLPSYVEVTSLDSGRTILVRLERRGPMLNDALLELSPDAAAQLGLAARKLAVRVRRVNPPEPERAMLRSGKQAAERMETPKTLVEVLRRKLPELASSAKEGAPAKIVRVDPDKVAEPMPVLAATVDAPVQAPKPVEGSANAQPAKSADLIVQVAAFSTQQRADQAAKPLDASVSKPGQFWLMRLGPYASHAEAEAGLKKAKAAGYSDARIKRAD